MPEYLVRWEIQLDAENVDDAAEKARQVQLDPDNIATRFRIAEMQDGITDEELSWQDVDFDPR